MNESFADEPLDQGKPFDPGAEHVPVEDSPVPAGPATLMIPGRPQRQGDRLVLRAPKWLFVATLFPLLIVAAMFRLDRLLWAGGQVDGPAIGIGVFLAGVMAWFTYKTLFLPRLTFDREAGLLMLGWRGLRGQRPLASVVGVQVLETRKRFGGPELNIAAITTYQLNLILDDPAEPRLNVTSGDLNSARTNARVIADFLGVPLLDSTGVPEGPAAPGAVEQAPMVAGFTTIPSPVLTEPTLDVLILRPSRFAFLHSCHGVWLLTMAVPLGGVAIFLIVGLVTGEWRWNLLPNHGGGAGQAGGGGDWWAAAFLLPVLFLEGLALLFLLLKFLGARARFDRGRGELKLGRFGFGKPRPLASVKAVQVVDSSQCQLNLVFDNAKQPRINLINEIEPVVVRKTAERLASFLSVPLLEAKRPASPTAGPRTGAPAETEPTHYLEELNRAPLPLGKASIRGPARIVRRGDDGLVVRPRSLVNWTWLGLALFIGGMSLFLAWLAWAGQGGQGGLDAWLQMLLFVPLGLVLGLKPLLLYRDRFDRQAGVLSVGWFGLKGTHPLEKILAVQLIPGGLIHAPAGPFSRRSGERVSYQMNLVLADNYQERLNLTEDVDLDWTRESARQIAEFLGVRVLDHIRDVG